MKVFIVTVFGLAVLLIAKLGLAIGGMAFVFTLAVILIAWHRIKYLLTIREYAKRIDNIYVVSNNPDTSEAVFHKLIVNVKFENVIKEVENQKLFLEASGNAFYCDDTLTTAQRLYVVPIIYQDGKYINETWEEFKIRVIAEIHADREARHAMLKKTDADWYMKFSNNQKGVEWVKK